MVTDADFICADGIGGSSLATVTRQLSTAV